jgi:hypothetical protein
VTTSTLLVAVVSLLLSILQLPAPLPCQPSTWPRLDKSSRSLYRRPTATPAPCHRHMRASLAPWHMPLQSPLPILRRQDSPRMLCHPHSPCPCGQWRPFDPCRHTRYAPLILLNPLPSSHLPFSTLSPQDPSTLCFPKPMLSLSLCCPWQLRVTSDSLQHQQLHRPPPAAPAPPTDTWRETDTYHHAPPSPEQVS